MGTGGKAAGGEAHHSPPASAKVKKMWLHSIPPYAFIVLLVKHGENFADNNILTTSSQYDYPSELSDPPVVRRRDRSVKLTCFSESGAELLKSQIKHRIIILIIINYYYK
jgi:hypothetical protein